MITLTGTLQVSTQHCLLHCSLGRFVVNDLRFQNIATGKYNGFFEIQKIEATVLQKSQGQMQVSLLAVVKEFSLNTMPINHKPSLKGKTVLLNSQLSLFDEEITEAQVSHSKREVPVGVGNPSSSVELDAVIPETTASTSPVEPEMPSTEGKLVFPEVVELDPTLSREQLRKTVAQLQSQGYRFEKSRQLWLKVA